MVDHVAVGVRDAAKLEVGRVRSVERDAGDDQRLTSHLLCIQTMDVVSMADAHGRLCVDCDAGDADVPPPVSRRTCEALAGAGRRQCQAQRHERCKHHDCAEDRWVTLEEVPILDELVLETEKNGFEIKYARRHAFGELRWGTRARG